VEVDGGGIETGYCKVTDCSQRDASAGCGEDCVKYDYMKFDFSYYGWEKGRSQSIFFFFYVY
jgi:hypothetical protein